MWKNYFLTAFRALGRQRLHTGINLAGLAVGVATSLLILMFVRYEYSYDTFHSNAENIYRLNLAGKLGDNEFRMTHSSSAAGPTMIAELPEVLNYTRIRNSGFPVLRYEDKVFSEEHWWQADSSIFEVFSIPMVLGDPKTALTEPFTVVITERMAHKYFGDENPLGKVLNSDNRVDFTVTGVVQELPPNSHWHFDFLGAMATYGDSRSPVWVNNNFQTYLLLQPGTDLDALENKFDDMVRRYVGPEVQQFLGISFDQMMARGDAYDLFLTALTDIHLYSHLNGEIETNGDGTTAKIFVGIALFILLLAAINYTNLATARSLSRAREIGIRKTLGGNRNQIMSQFLVESVLVTFLAMMLALALVAWVLPWFSQLIDTPLSMEWSDVPWVLLASFPLGVLAGLYPATVLSAFRPVAVLKGSGASPRGKQWVRNALVVIQFSVSITLLIATFVIHAQLSYMQTKDLGLNPENILLVEKTDDIGRSMPSFKAGLREIQGVQSFSNSTAIPGNDDGINGSAMTMVVDGEERTRLLANFWVDYGYLETFGLNMTNGRFFSRERSLDSLSVVINEAAVKSYGLTDPIGKELVTHFGQDAPPFTVIGVVSDYHMESPQKEIRPLVMFLLGEGDAQERPNWGKFVALKVDPHQREDVLYDVERQWKQFAGGQALETEDFDELYHRLFQAERQAAQILSLFALLAIFIAALGMLGLASFNATKRTKEIGIRKVLGASVTSILVLLSKDTLKLVSVSVAIAIPVAYWSMNQWLMNYAFRISMPWAAFVMAPVLAIAVAVVTVSLQSLVVVNSNPVQALRAE